MRVYPGKLQVSDAFGIISVDGNTTIKDLIVQSLERFKLDPADADDYRLSEVLLDRGGMLSIYF